MRPRLAIWVLLYDAVRVGTPHPQSIQALVSKDRRPGLRSSPPLWFWRVFICPRSIRFRVAVGVPLVIYGIVDSPRKWARTELMRRMDLSRLKDQPARERPLKRTRAG